MAITRVCIYTRISTDEENQPTSLHSQRERLQTFCTAQEGWRIVAHKQDQATGTKLDRPGLQAALDLARSGAVDMLLVYRVDRLSRKVRQLAQLTEELDALGVVLKSATEPFDTGAAAGRMMLQMLAVFAEFEHATIVDRISAGIERRAKEGKWATGRLPFGYRRNDEKQVVPDERTAPTVKRIFELYTRDRLGTAAVARVLGDEHAPAPAAGWQPTVVQWVLENEAYLGRVIWRGQSLPGLHEPLIDEVTFTRAQRLLRERGEDMALRRSNPGDYLLSGLLHCGRCKRAYVGMSAKGNGGTYHYYACSGRQKYGPKACDGDRLPREKIEQAVIDQLAALYRDEQVITDALARANAEAEKQRPEFEHRRASLSAEIVRAEQALERYYEAFERGKLSAERCEDRLVRLQARLDDLHAQEVELSLAAPHEAAHAPTAADLTGIADVLEAVATEGDPPKAKALLRLLIDELRVNGRREILPTYRLVTPAVCAMSEKVGRAGIEPATLGLKVPCSTS